MKKIITAVTAIVLALSLAIPVSAAPGGWYCKRNKEHKQPTLDPQMAVIEKYDAYNKRTKGTYTCPYRI